MYKIETAYKNHRMSKIAQSKTIPCKIHVADFMLELRHSRITAFAIIDDEDKDLSINQEEFETFVDDNDLREGAGYDFNPITGDIDLESSTTPWAEIYDYSKKLIPLLESYIRYSYAMDAMDIETPLKQITSTHKKAI